VSTISTGRALPGRIFHRREVLRSIQNILDSLAAVDISEYVESRQRKNKNKKKKEKRKKKKEDCNQT